MAGGGRRVLVIFVLSNLLWGIALLTPWLPLRLHEKVIVSAVCATLGEIAFWVFVSMVGKEAAQRYRRYLSIGYWRERWFGQRPAG
ncbi:transporter suffix domain-containing protein [Crenobacter intestini]|uniref:Transporter suffix domain-containing protein n=1 Tax=Crenobacter intestini TaxID=2563443 RepID=A0A4T0V4J9_9NEIS|nr:transporter suffix domain-containing protein [Crenobacter intestini]TIC86166.1 transporter suffix domain-containing protein [Crenobacter intestini]